MRVLWVRLMSDNFTNRPFSGNLQKSWDEPGKQVRYRGAHRLVEEAEEVCIRGVQRALGKKTLIASIRQAQPVRLPILGGHFDIWLVNENHRLPGREQRWSSLEAGTCRLWLLCPGCRRPCAKLYFYRLGPDTFTTSELLCRRCHELVYQSAICGGNKWYREIVRPLKWLLKEKRKLLARKQTARAAARLTQIESAICTLRQKVQPKTQRRRERLLSRVGLRQRRFYRNLALIEQQGGRGVETIGVHSGTENNQRV